MPSSPLAVLLVVIASLHAVLFHLLFGRTAKEMAVYWLVALAGFGLGQWIAGYIPWHIWEIGDLYVIEASLLCWLALFIAKRLKV